MGKPLKLGGEMLYELENSMQLTIVLRSEVPAAPFEGNRSLIA